MTSTLVADVLAELDAHRARFEALCRSLTPGELDRPVPGSTWLVRDFIAHLATIDRPVADMFRAWHERTDPGLRTPEGAPFDVDRWNDARVLERRDRSVEELLAEAAEARAHLKRHLEALSDDDVGRTMKFGGDGKRPPGEWPIATYLRGWCKHDVMHALDMSRALPERLTPELQAWFDDPVVQGYQRAMNRA